MCAITSIKIKFRPSKAKPEQGTVYYQICRRRTVRQITTPYSIGIELWPVVRPDRPYNTSADTPPEALRIREHIEWDITRIDRLCRANPFLSADEIIGIYNDCRLRDSVFRFIDRESERIRQLGRARTSETYTAALKSFSRFRQGHDLPFDGITSEMMQSYQAHLQARGLTMNTISFYMRIMRSCYNRAVDEGITEQRAPFRHVYTGIDRTIKRAIGLSAIRRIRNLDLSASPVLAFARDMFLFSFYTRGMSFIDMAFLRKCDLNDGVLAYRRRKTGQLLRIRWEHCMEEIASRHAGDDTSPYLLPIIRRPGKRERAQYKSPQYTINLYLKKIA
ncbi:MAG: site-specific integrase, partial [Muribaculaceae bacterium]|nr:site-specific integrase [Muribaculaceae bacterium]